MSTERTPRILIIDNDEAVTRAIATRLESLGYTCVTAVDGAQGLAEFQCQEIDLIVTDLNMPAGDGISLATAIRRMSDVPIIFVSGFSEEYKQRLGELVDVTVLPKPFDSNALVELVETELAVRGCFGP